MKRISLMYMKLIAGMVLLYLLFPAITNAQHYMYTLEELCQKSTDIIQAEVLSVSPYWNSEKTRIYSDVRIKIIQNFKGNLKNGDDAVIRMIGGTVDDITMFIAGHPGFSVKEQAILFLRESRTRNKNNYVLYALGQGKFKIFKDNKTNKEKVLRQRILRPFKVSKNGFVLNITKDNSISLTELIGYIESFTDN